MREIPTGMKNKLKIKNCARLAYAVNDQKNVKNCYENLSICSIIDKAFNTVEHKNNIINIVVFRQTYFIFIFCIKYRKNRWEMLKPVFDINNIGDRFAISIAFTPRDFWV
jgi:hypothetical protein